MAKAMRSGGTILGYITHLFDGIKAEVKASSDMSPAKRLAHSPSFRAVVLLVAVYVISLFALFRANAYYIDDMGRAMWGYDGWGSSFSRYLSDFLSHIVHATDFLADIAPIPQLLAVVIIVAASIISIKEIKSDAITPWDVIAVVPLGLSPYFLECLSYRYDAPYMALSVLLGVVPLCWRHGKIPAFCLASAVCTIGVCTTYQAALGIYPAVVALIAVLEWSRGKAVNQTMTFIVCAVIGYSLGVLIFRFFIMQSVDTYVSNSLASVSQIIDNYRKYYERVLGDAKGGWIAVATAIALWFVASTAWASKRNKPLTACICVVLVAMELVFAFGLYPLLSAPLFAPRAMFGIGAVVAFLGVGAMSNRVTPWLGILLSVILGWSLVTFASAYGNALFQQGQWEDYRRQELLDDLTDLSQFIGDEEKRVVIEGSVGYAPSISEVMTTAPILKRLVPVTFRGNWAWGTYKLENYYGLRGVEFTTEYSGDASQDELVQESAYHQIYYDGDGSFLVILK